MTRSAGSSRAARFEARALRVFAQRLLEAHGLGERHAEITAHHLVEADLLGYTTHGIDLLPIYTDALATGELAKEGTPDVLSDHGAAVIWDGKHLSGQTLISDAVDAGLNRLNEHGVVTVVIRRSHHTGCHATHLASITQRRAMGIITAASTVGRRIAPFGGTTPAFSPSPFAVAIPAADPIHIDMTMASVANSVCRQHHQRGESLPHPWLLTADGHVTDDPGTLYGERPGTILPLGGIDNGHKGFALILMVEALTVALGGGVPKGDAIPNLPSQSVFVQLIDPNRFGGTEAFEQRIDTLASALRAAQPAAGGDGVRLPGERSHARRHDQLARGVVVGSDVVARVSALGDSFSVGFPAPIA